MSWPDSPTVAGPPRRSVVSRAAGALGALLVCGGAAVIGLALASVQPHAPRPAAAAAGTVGRLSSLTVSRSMPVSVAIPAIGVDAHLLHLGLNANGTMQVPPLPAHALDAAWYRYSAAPGQLGAAVIEGHVDSRSGPAVFFRLGALRPGDLIRVRLADGVTATFRVTGVRSYRKAEFPARAVYSAAGYAALRLITCGGAFDTATGHYLSSTVVFASLVSARTT